HTSFSYVLLRLTQRHQTTFFSTSGGLRGAVGGRRSLRIQTISIADGILTISGRIRWRTDYTPDEMRRLSLDRCLLLLLLTASHADSLPLPAGDWRGHHDPPHRGRRNAGGNPAAGSTVSQALQAANLVIGNLDKVGTSALHRAQQRRLRHRYPRGGKIRDRGAGHPVRKTGRAQRVPAGR
ncbi:MAG: hypothetical protein MZV64_33050, partial [Ignavibacteriales bacterium]|nr:hypothetical protein [Ignavibacteriales bacterium]